MVTRSPLQKHWQLGLLVVILISSAGCMGFFGSSDTSAGELQIDNQHNQSHEVLITVSDKEMVQTVGAGSSQTITLVESPGTYSVNATIDGTNSVNTTVDYSPGGRSGEQLAGPGLILILQEDGEAYFSQTYD